MVGIAKAFAKPQYFAPLGHSLRETNLQVLFLSETTAGEERKERVMKAIGFAEKIVLGSAGRSGRI